MKKIYLLLSLWIFSILLTWCFTKIEVQWEIETKNVQQEQSNYTGYYFIGATPRSSDFFTDLSVIDPWNTPLETWARLIMSVSWFENGDIVKVYFSWDIEEIKGANSHSPTRTSTPHKIEKIWSLKDELFIQRDNSDYKLQPEEIQEPIIKSRKNKCQLFEETFDETTFEFTYPDLWIKITIPECWDYEYKVWEDAFIRSWATIIRSWAHEEWDKEYLTVYTKDPNQSLEDVIRERHLNPWCTTLNQKIRIAFWDDEWTWYSIYSKSWYSDSAEPTTCYSDDEDDNISNMFPNVYYFQSAKRKDRYYKLRFWDACAPWPCSIFWKIEVL